VLALSAPTQQYEVLKRLAHGAFSQSQPGVLVLRHRCSTPGMATFRSIYWSASFTSASTPSPAPTHRTFVPGRLRLNTSTTSNNDHLWAAARASITPRAMDPPRPKRTRARVSYVEPTELDDDIAGDEPAAPVPASEDHVSETELDATEIETDSGSDDEFTTDKVSYLNAR